MKILNKLAIIPLLIIGIVCLTALNVLDRYTRQIDVKNTVIKVDKKIMPGEQIKLDENAVKAKLSKEWLSNVQYVNKLEDKEPLYAKETLFPGDYLRSERVSIKNESLRKPVEKGFERIAVKIEKPENGVSFKFKVGNAVAVDCTCDLNMVKGITSKKILEYDLDKDQNGVTKKGKAVIRLLEAVPIIAICDKDSNEIIGNIEENGTKELVDTVVFDVRTEDAILIQSLREGKFELTKLYQNDNQNKEKNNKDKK